MLNVLKRNKKMVATLLSGIFNLLQLINLPLGVVGHEGSTILVILNGLRLLAFKHKESHQDS